MEIHFKGESLNCSTMNGRYGQPIEGGLNKTPRQDELIFTGIEVKQEPTVKPEPTDTVDMVTITTSERTASGSHANFVGGEQTSDTDDFIDVRDLADVKSEVKKERKDDNGMEKDSAENCEEDENDSNDFHSNRSQSKPKRRSIAEKNANENVGEA